MSFVHLHLHTLYSLLDGAIRMKDLIKTATAMKMPAVAVTDHGNMFGTIDFYRKAKEAQIKPIIGIETYVAVKGLTDRTERASHHLVLLAQSVSTRRCSPHTPRDSSLPPPAWAARSPSTSSTATWTAPAPRPSSTRRSSSPATSTWRSSPTAWPSRSASTTP